MTVIKKRSSDVFIESNDEIIIKEGSVFDPKKYQPFIINGVRYKTIDCYVKSQPKTLRLNSYTTAFNHVLQNCLDHPQIKKYDGKRISFEDGSKKNNLDKLFDTQLSSVHPERSATLAELFGDANKKIEKINTAAKALQLVLLNA